MNHSVISLYSEVQTATNQANAKDVHAVTLVKVPLAKLAEVWPFTQEEFKSLKTDIATNKIAEKYKNGTYWPVFKNEFVQSMRPKVNVNYDVDAFGKVEDTINQFLVMGELVLNTGFSNDVDNDVNVNGNGTVDAFNVVLGANERVTDDFAALNAKIRYFDSYLSLKIDQAFDEDLINEAIGGVIYHSFGGIQKWIQMNRMYTILPLEKELEALKMYITNYKSWGKYELLVNTKALSALMPAFGPLVNYFTLMSADSKVVEKLKATRPNDFGVNKNWIAATEPPAFAAEVYGQDEEIQTH